MAIPTISTPLDACFSRISMSIGISSKQGAHQVAQKFTTTMLPRHSARLRGLPDRSVNRAAATDPAPSVSRRRNLGPIKNPAVAAASATPASATASRLRSAMLGRYQRADFGDAGALLDPAHKRGLERQAFVAMIEHRKLYLRTLPIEGQYRGAV